MLQQSIFFCRGSAGSACTLENGVGFLTFSADGSNVGYGFRAHVVAAPANVNTDVDSVHFFNETQEFTYPPDSDLYESNARALAIFQTEQGVTNSLQLTYLRTEQDFDFVHFIRIYSYRDALNPVVVGRYEVFFHCSQG